MHAVRIYSEAKEVFHRLSDFETSVDEMIPVIEAIIGARNDIVGIDARTAAGTKAYLAGVRHTRFLFLPKGWIVDCTNGVESVLNPETGVKIVYQSVDQACVKFKSPQAINGKGPAAESAVKAAQGLLFSIEELPEVTPDQIGELNSSVWYLCVSANENDDDDVRVELSLPAAIMSGNFRGFLERIFIVDYGQWKDRGASKHKPDDGDPYEIRIERK